MDKLRELEKASQTLSALYDIYKIGGENELEGVIFVGMTAVKFYIYTSEERGVENKFEVRLEGVSPQDISPAVNWDFSTESPRFDEIVREIRIREGI